MFRNHLPTSNNIVKRNDRLDARCALCAVWKDANHVFFRYHFSRFLWSAVREATELHWDLASSAELILLLNSLRGVSKHVMWPYVEPLLWAIRQNDNKIMIEVALPHPADHFFQCNVYLQQWMLLGKRSDVDSIVLAINKL